MVEKLMKMELVVQVGLLGFRMALLTVQTFTAMHRMRGYVVL